jgi:hypothetical protein
MNANDCNEEFAAREFGSVGMFAARRDSLGVSQAAATGRVEYVKMRDNWPTRVIADFDTDGRGAFCEQEFGEVRWYPYLPSQSEVTFALGLLLEAQRDDSDDTCH